MKHIKVCAIFISIVVSACTLRPGVSSADNLSFEKSGVLKNDTKVSVLVGVSKYPAKDFMYSSPVWWGTELSSPKTFIKKLIVRLGDKESWVRFSAYSDLVNVNKVDLNISDGGFNIAIDGGQTATHYKATIYFDNEGFLLKRKVYGTTFSDEVWEETVYSFIRTVR